MKDRIIQLPDGRVVAFPSTMSDADIGKAIQDMMPKGGGFAEQPPPSGIDARPKTLGDYVGRTFENIPNSAGAFFENIPRAVVNLPQVAATLSGAAGPDAQMEGISQIGKALVQRYGGADAIANTLMTDPVGFAADLSALLGGAGAVGGASKVGQALRSAGAVVDPIAGPVGLVKRGIPSTLTQPERLMESAMKVPPSVSAAERDAAIQTMLTRRPMGKRMFPNASTAENVKAQVGQLNTQIADALANRANAGETLNIYDVTGPGSNPLIRETMDAASVSGPDAVRNLDLVQNRIQDMRSVPSVSKYGPDLPLTEAQKIKQGIYKTVSYGEDPKQFKEATDKAIAYGLKEGIAQKAPEVSALNKEESAYLALGPHLERAVNRIRNQEPIKLGTVVGLTAPSTSKAVATSGMNQILNSPMFKAYLAHILATKQGLPAFGPFISGTSIAGRE